MAMIVVAENVELQEKAKSIPEQVQKQEVDTPASEPLAATQDTKSNEPAVLTKANEGNERQLFSRYLKQGASTHSFKRNRPPRRNQDEDEDPLQVYGLANVWLGNPKEAGEENTLWCFDSQSAKDIQDECEN